MTEFRDGPAHGKVLMLKRAPLFLRVVMNNQGEFDALDQLKDSARPDETIFAYLREKDAGAIHLNLGRGRGGFYVMAEYRLFESQPTDAQMRSNSEWKKWCVANDPKK